MPAKVRAAVRDCGTRHTEGAQIPVCRGHGKPPYGYGNAREANYATSRPKRYRPSISRGGGESSEDTSPVGGSPARGRTALDIPTSADLATLTPSDLYRRLRFCVPRLVTCLIGRAAPEELVHDAATEVVLSLGRFRRACDFSTWVHAVVMHQVWMWVRNRQRYHHLLRDFVQDFTRSDCVDPERAVDSKRALSKLAEAFHGLPTQQQRSLALTEVDGRSVQETADALHCTPAAVRTSVCRARTHLRHALAAPAVPQLGSPHPTTEQVRLAQTERRAYLHGVV
jgi:RNA polymerase sigma-70 factor, ECF subfamily